MAKTIKFNLICDNTPVRTIEDLQNNFSIEDVLNYYRNGLLCRWLKVRGYEEELKKVEEIRSEDSMGIIKELIRIFEIPCDPAEVEKSIYILKYKVESESENEQYKQEGYKVEGIIEDYQQGYRSLLNTVFENQNDAAQIKAAIQEIVEKYKWVLQYDYLNPGSNTDYNASFSFIPYYQNIKITAKNEAGEEINTTAFLGVTDGKCGRGIGWIQPTSHFFNDIWSKGSENDIRNSEYNIIRDVRIDNPESPAFGQWLVKDGYYKQLDSIRQWYPLMTKISRVNNFPEEFYQKDANGNPLMTPFGEHLVINSANGSYKDVYLFRLAETYLLRAEAYVNKGDQAKAAADVNTVRSRANADPAQPAEVNIDYILDERLRELYCEELRMLTLCRMGKLADRNRRYNPRTGMSIEDYHNLWPIPYSEIERNVYATIEQNPGY